MASEIKKTIIIINGISSGTILTKELYKEFNLIHIESDQKIQCYSSPSFNKEYFSTLISWDEKAKEQLVTRLKSINPIAVIPGSESGVALAEALSKYLDIEANDPKTTNLRRNKYAMSKAASSFGLSVAPQFCSRSVEDIHNWYKSYEEGKVVVKPSASAGSDDVYICTTSEEVIEAAINILGRKNNFVHINNDDALIQGFIYGTEFVVNTVTLRDKSKVTDIWKVSKCLVEGRNLYDFDDLYEPNSDASKQCISYTLKLLRSVGITKGAGHTELMLTQSGPVLIEIGARASGAANPKAIRHATGSDQIEMMCHSYTNSELFNRGKDVYDRDKFLRCVHAISSKTKSFDHASYKEFIETLPGFVDVVLKKSDKEILTPTIDVQTCPAAFFLCADSQEEIEFSYQEYRKWEANNL